MPETSEGGLKRQPPDVTAPFRVLDEAGVNYVVIGSAAAMLHGVGLVPGDLDITTAMDVDNLTRLAAVLDSVEARQDPSAPFGHWQRGDDGEQHWVETARTPEAVAARANWRPNPLDAHFIRLSPAVETRRTPRERYPSTSTDCVYGSNRFRISSRR